MPKLYFSSRWLDRNEKISVGRPNGMVRGHRTSTCGPFYTHVSGKSLTPGFLDTEPAVVGHFLSVALHWTPRKKMARNNRGTVVPARDLALGGAFTVYTVICSLVTLAT